MSKSPKTIIVIILAVAACGAALWLCLQYLQGLELADYEIKLESPMAGGTVTSPLTVTGHAHANWYFKGEFPIELRDANDEILAEGVATMQEGARKAPDGYIPFIAVILFNATAGEQGTLVLKRSNPNGEDNNYRTDIPIVF